MDSLSPHADSGNNSLKRCRDCKQSLDTSCFNKNKWASDGLAYICKECRKQYRRVHPEKRNPCLVVTKSQKYCPTCEQILDASRFNKNKAQPDGLAPHCKTCRKALSKIDHEIHREREALRYQRYYPLHKEEYGARGKLWHEANREQHNESNRKNHREHKEQYQAKHKIWEVANPWYRSVSHSRRRAREQGNGGSFTNAEWKHLLEFYDYTCLKCGRREPEIKLTADHVLPLYLGGTSNIENIQPLCKSCNPSKGTKHIDYRMRKENTE